MIHLKWLKLNYHCRVGLFHEDGGPMFDIFHAYFVPNCICQILYKMSNIYFDIYEEEIRLRFNTALKKFLDTKEIIDHLAGIQSNFFDLNIQD